jgi:predicted glycosyltransferase
MRYLFVANTPAHVHLFRHPASRLQEMGHEVLVVARDYGCTVDLLEYHEVPHVVANRAEMSQLSVLTDAPNHIYSRLSEARAFDPDVVFGMGADTALVGAALRVPVVLVVDSEPDGLDHAISKRLSRVLLTPHAFGKDLGKKQYRFRGFKENAYLHPDVFEPDTSVREELGLEPDEPFAILRFNAWGAHHDVSQEGINPRQRRELIEKLADHVTVLVSDEEFEGESFDLDGRARAFDIHPARLHDALAEADLLVADTQTMVTEAALMGTPAIRSNSFVGDDDMGNFQELEEAGLIYNTRNFETVLDRSLDIVSDPDAGTEWMDRRDAYMADQVNLTDLLLDVAENQGEMDAVEATANWRFDRTPTA